MNRKGAILAGVTALALLASGVVVASALNDLPQDAQPAQTPTADLNRQPTPPVTPVPQEPAPEAEPAPARPIAITPPAVIAGGVPGQVVAVAELVRADQLATLGDREQGAEGRAAGPAEDLA